LRVTVLLPQQVKHVRGVAGVDYPEAWGQAEGRGVLSNEVMSDRMKCAPEDPAGPVGHGHQRSRALQHLACGAPRERQ
jgi:hypothetical protein